MEKSEYRSKGYDLVNQNRLKKLRNEFSNPYGCNIYSTNCDIVDSEYNITHTNQNSRQR